jgi:hypothetical protein
MRKPPLVWDAHACFPLRPDADLNLISLFYVLGVRQMLLAAGISIEEPAQVLFEGLAQDQLYIGPQAFMEQLPDLGAWIRSRAENIVQEKTPGV